MPSPWQHTTTNQQCAHATRCYMMSLPVRKVVSRKQKVRRALHGSCWLLSPKGGGTIRHNDGVFHSWFWLEIQKGKKVQKFSRCFRSKSLPQPRFAASDNLLSRVLSRSQRRSAEGWVCVSVCRASVSTWWIDVKGSLCHCKVHLGCHARPHLKTLRYQTYLTPPLGALIKQLRGFLFFFSSECVERLNSV